MFGFFCGSVSLAFRSYSRTTAYHHTLKPCSHLAEYLPWQVHEVCDRLTTRNGSAELEYLVNDRLLNGRIEYLLQHFHEGLQAYFEKFKYSNASTQDLWAVLETTGVDQLSEFMSLWTKQTGYPVVSVRLIRAHDGTYSIGVKQQRFLADSSSATSERLFSSDSKLKHSSFATVC